MFIAYFYRGMVTRRDRVVPGYARLREDGSYGPLQTYTECWDEAKAQGALPAFYREPCP